MPSFLRAADPIDELGVFELHASGEWECHVLANRPGLRLWLHMETGLRGRVKIVLKEDPGFLLACGDWEGPADLGKQRRLLASVRRFAWGRLEWWKAGQGARLRLWIGHMRLVREPGAPSIPWRGFGRSPRPAAG